MRGGLFGLCLLIASCRVGSGGGGDGVTIMEIQGTGARSPLEGEVVMTTGVVTAVREDGRGFWIQDPRGDDDPETSDGVLVWTELSVVEGDRVRVRGTVAEFAREGERSTTQIQDIESLEVLSTGNELPGAMALPLLPDVSIPDAIQYWSRLERMLVSFERARVVAPTNRFGELVVVLDGQAPDGNHVLLRSLGDDAVDYNPERIIIDDETRDAIEARAGDAIENFTGVVDYSFGNYKLQPLELSHVEGVRAEMRPRSTGGVAIASFNVENLFDNDPDELEVKLAALADYVEDRLLLPEILVVQEVENEAVLQRLGDRLNIAAGTHYQAKGLGSSDGRGIENAFLYDRACVRLDEAFLLSGPDVEAAFGPNSPSAGREPLVGRFSLGGSELIVVGNHFKSKGGDEPIFGARQPFERPTEVQRKLQARAVRRYVDELLDHDERARILVAGDFNDFPFAEPGEGPDHPLGILEGKDLTNLVGELPGAYTFIFDGNAQVLDHLLVSPALGERVLGVEIVHGNADDPESASDHDTPVVRLQFP